MLGSTAFPKVPGVEEGYVVTVKALDFIQQILTDSNGRLRQRIFDENVRDFIGSHSEINVEMAETLQDNLKQKRFGILNNGVTIISPDIRLTGFDVFMRDFQIVNGCQTSNVLFENRSNIGDETTLMLKIVETADNNVVDDIVRSTNRQTKVEDEQFLATLDSIKALERYFDAKGLEDEYRLYFERRKNQFSAREDVKAIRVFSIREIARCFAAMFLDKPDIASRYPNKLTGELKNMVFSKKYVEEVYHVSAYAHYRIVLLMGNGKIEPGYRKLRWHILMAIKYFVLGEKIADLGSNKIKNNCDAIEKFLNPADEKNISKIRDLCSAIFEKDDITRDKIKTPSFSQEIKTKALAYRAKLDSK